MGYIDEIKLLRLINGLKKTVAANLNLKNGTGEGSILENAATEASGVSSHAEGYQSKAKGAYSHAEGQQSYASGIRSHAEGSGSATGVGSHAEGASSAIGQNSHAEGWGTSAYGDYSHTEGMNTRASNLAQHVFGAYNVVDEENNTSSVARRRGKYVEIVGNGSSMLKRSNARTLDWNGNEVLAGSCTASQFNGSGAGLTGVIRSINGFSGDVLIDFNSGSVSEDLSSEIIRGREYFSHTVAPEDWSGPDSKNWFANYPSGTDFGVTLQQNDTIVLTSVINETTGLNPQNGYAFSVKQALWYTIVEEGSDEEPELADIGLQFFYSNAKGDAPSEPIRFEGYVIHNGTGTGEAVFVTGMDSGYPVGSIFKSFYDTSPALIYGGTWERIEGKFLLGATDGGSTGTNVLKTASVAAGSSGGEAAHTLAVSEIPSHHHTEHGYWSTGSGSLSAYMNSSDRSREQKTTENTGGGGSHNTMPPFIAVYMWTRVA